MSFLKAFKTLNLKTLIVKLSSNIFFYFFLLLFLLEVRHSGQGTMTKTVSLNRTTLEGSFPPWCVSAQMSYRLSSYGALMWKPLTSQLPLHFCAAGSPGLLSMHSVWDLQLLRIRDSGTRPWESSAGRCCLFVYQCSQKKKSVTFSILQGRAVWPVSDWQGVNLRERGTRGQAVLLDGTGTSGALLPISIVKFLDESH